MTISAFPLAEMVGDVTVECAGCQVYLRLGRCRIRC